MNAYKLALIVWMVLAGLATVAQIGKPRKETTPEIAVGVLILLAIEAALVVAA